MRPRQKLAREFGATDIVAERGDEGVEHIKDMTNGVGADAVLECVGTAKAMQQAISATRPGGFVGFVGVPHGVSFEAPTCSSPMSACAVAPRPCGASCLT